jgi:hypothetical protein
MNIGILNKTRPQGFARAYTPSAFSVYSLVDNDVTFGFKVCLCNGTFNFYIARRFNREAVFDISGYVYRTKEDYIPRFKVYIAFNR